MPFTNRYTNCAIWLLIAAPAFSAGSTLVVDRGLPQNNLNNVSGAARSNVRWAMPDDGFLGDDFVVGAPGEHWVIDAIRTWTVPGVKSGDPQHLSDYFQDVRLYFGGPKEDLTPVTTAKLAAGSETTSNENVQISDATANGAIHYDDFGTPLRVWQVDFTNLNARVKGGTKYRFGVWGIGRAKPDQEGKTYLWFNYASNAGLSGAKQEHADGAILQFDGAGRYLGELNTQGSVWDKPADINVQVFAHRVDLTQ